MRTHRFAQSRLSVGMLLLLIVNIGQSAAQEITIVTPNGVEGVEGNGSSHTNVPGYREQDILPATDFTGLSEGHRRLIRIAFRADQQVTTPSTFTQRDYTVRLSTSNAAPDNLSLTYADNVGPDETLVFEGDLTFSTSATGPSQGPREFDFVIDFQTPFDYDPAQGNLLLDFSASSVEGVTYLDGHSLEPSLTRRIGGFDPNGTVATVTESDARVFQFTFVSELPTFALGDVNLDGEVNGLDVDSFVDVLLNGPFQAEADMNEDQVVNGLDVDPFVAAVVGGTHQIPEPSTLLLALVALSVVGGWRKWRR